MECNGYEYWEKVSDEMPYPGMECDKGPSKTIGVTFFIAKNIERNDYVTTENDIEIILAQLNKAFSPHGINFKLREMVYATGESPQLSKLRGNNPKETLENWYKDVLKEDYNPNDLNFIFSPYSGFSCPSDLWELAPHVLISRCQSAPANIRKTPMVHEVGHFFGLLHTHHNAEYITTLHEDRALNKLEDFRIRGPNWVNPKNECNKNGDYICDTPLDCFDYCEDVLGCKGLKFCGDDYKPLTRNIMSYYPGYINGNFTKEQGARMRYFLMHRFKNNISGNTLMEY